MESRASVELYRKRQAAKEDRICQRDEIDNCTFAMEYQRKKACSSRYYGDTTRGINVLPFGGRKQRRPFPSYHVTMLETTDGVVRARRMNWYRNQRNMTLADRAGERIAKAADMV